MPKRDIADDISSHWASSGVQVPPKKRAKWTADNMSAMDARCDERMTEEESKDSTEQCREAEETPRAAVAIKEETPAAATAAAMPPPSKGIILRSGRIRLPDKLIQYLNNEVAPSSLFWQPDGQGFSIDCDTVQKELLDKHFHGTKLSSFLRSLNRWGFKRLFYHSMPKSTLSFHHPLFRKDSPDLSKEMNMAPCASSGGNGAPATDAKKKAKEGPDAPASAEVPKSEPPPVANPAPVAAAAPRVATILASVAAAGHAPTSASDVSVPSTQTNAAVSLNASQPVLNGLLGHLRTQIPVETVNKKDLLLQQVQQLLASSQQQQQAQQPALDASALLALMPAPTQTHAPNQNALDFLEGVLSSLVGASQPQPVVQPQVQVQPQLRLLQLQAELQRQQQSPHVQLSQPPSITNGQQQASSPLASLAAAIALRSGLPAAAAPPAAPQPIAPSQASLLQLLSPQQQLALLNQISSNGASTAPAAPVPAWRNPN